MHLKRVRSKVICQTILGIQHYLMNVPTASGAVQLSKYNTRTSSRLKCVSLYAVVMAVYLGKRPACRHHYVRVEQSDSQVSNSSHYMYTVSKERLYRTTYVASSSLPPHTHTLHISPLYQNYQWQQSAVVSLPFFFFSISLLAFLCCFVPLFQSACFRYFLFFSVQDD